MQEVRRTTGDLKRRRWEPNDKPFKTTKLDGVMEAVQVAEVEEAGVAGGRVGQRGVGFDKIGEERGAN